jgi:hypothetical protein
MPALKFHLAEEMIKALSWEDYEALEMAQEGDVKLYRLRPLLARFVVDESLKPIPQSTALKMIAKVPMDQVPEIIKQFMEALKDKAVPKGIGLLSPSESTQAEESQAGATP